MIGLISNNCCDLTLRWIIYRNGYSEVSIGYSFQKDVDKRKKKSALLIRQHSSTIRAVILQSCFAAPFNIGRPLYSRRHHLASSD